MTQTPWRLRAPNGGPGIVLFLNAGDPAEADLELILLACDRHGIAAVELAVPFPDSPTVRLYADRHAEHLTVGRIWTARGPFETRVFEGSHDFPRELGPSVASCLNAVATVYAAD
ncbi:MAG: hypothetical protein Q4F67_14125 [Propionibacteriaceae bacterium]|nr:hypothetical protein [Propionibacteriaceae bacterium]